MGSTSDLPVMQEAIDVLDELGLAYEVDIVSAHRTPKKLMDYGQNAHKEVSGHHCRTRRCGTPPRHGCFREPSAVIGVP